MVSQITDKTHLDYFTQKHHDAPLQIVSQLLAHIILRKLQVSETKHNSEILSILSHFPITPMFCFHEIHFLLVGQLC